jgi:hypothetical protein
MPTPPPTYSIGFALSQHLQSLSHFRMRECHLVGDRGEMRIEIALRHLDIFRDINQNRAWTA